MPELIDQHYPAVYRYALMISCSPHDAADLTQYAFTQFMRRTEPLRDPGRAAAYLRRTVYNQFINHVNQRNRHTSLETMETHPPSETKTDPSTRMDAQLVLDAMQQLEPDMRNVLFLFYHDGMTCVEISETLNIPFGTVASRLSRGKTRLRESMGVSGTKTI